MSHKISPEGDTNPLKKPKHKNKMFSSLLNQFGTNKRIKRGNNKFMDALMKMIEDNGMQKIFVLPKEQLQSQLMELSRELLNPNKLDANRNQKTPNFWHLQEEKQNIIQAEKLVKSFVEFTNDKFEEFVKAMAQSVELTKAEVEPEYVMEVDSTGADNDDYIYDAYIDLIRTLMLQDQEGPPGSENLMQDLFNQYEGPAVIRQGACEVRITGAQFFPVPVNGRNFVNPNKRTTRSTMRRRLR